MKLIIDGDISVTYVETLCMIFFPGAKFSTDSCGDGAEVRVSLRHDDSGTFAEASISAFGKTESASGFLGISAESDVKRRSKIAVGEAVLRAGTALLGSAPPWGMLSGVRPSKIASRLLSSGTSRENVINTLIDEYHVSIRKARLVTDVALREADLCKNLSPDKCSVYISIPFCPTRCSYCSFISYATPRLLSLIPEYLEYLCTDIEKTAETIRERGMTPHTVYIGGGTPSILTYEQLDKLLETIGKHFCVNSLSEFTLEAGRPDTITEEKLSCAVSHGVSRISINPQTLNDSVLQRIGRAHTADDFRRAFSAARKSGVKIINTDLIAGLPGDCFDSFKSTLDEIVSLAPENVTVHTFTVKRSASLKEKGEAVYSYTGGDAAECVSYAQDALTQAGYLPYYLYRQKNTLGNLENTGYAKYGTEGLYNILIMEELQNIYGIGAGAVTKEVGGAPEDKIVRHFEPKYPYEWIEKKRAAGISEKR